MRSQLSLCTFLPDESLVDAVVQVLDAKRYNLSHFQARGEFLKFVEQHQQDLDCLIVQSDPALLSVTEQLNEEGSFLPAVILEIQDSGPPSSREPFYHKAEVQLSVERLNQLTSSIERAIAEFIHLSPTERFIQKTETADPAPNSKTQHSLMQQQRRLSEKLKERLGYLGVYYKRNPKLYLRNLPEIEREQFVRELKSAYREIILNYFSQDSSLNTKIDEFVNLAFFADISVTYVVEIHMALMDLFSKQLKLEGRSEDILLDYRLTLIDVIAHLSEMYRRSIPRNN